MSKLASMIEEFGKKEEELENLLSDIASMILYDVNRYTPYAVYAKHIDSVYIVDGKLEVFLSGRGIKFVSIPLDDLGHLNLHKCIQ